MSSLTALVLALAPILGPPTCHDILDTLETTTDAEVLEACVLEMTSDEDAWRMVERRLALPEATGLAGRLLERGERHSVSGRLRVLGRLGDVSIAPELQRRALGGDTWRAPYVHVLLELDPPRAFAVIDVLRERAAHLDGDARRSALRRLDHAMRVGPAFIARADLALLEQLADTWEPPADGWCDPTSDDPRDTRSCDRPWTFVAALHARVPWLARRWIESGEPHERKLALAALRSVPPETVPDVPVELLADDDAVVRLLALRAMIHGRSCESARLYRLALGDGDDRVRARAAVALARCGDDTVAPILETLAGDHPCAALALESLRLPAPLDSRAAPAVDPASAEAAARSAAEAAARRHVERRALAHAHGCE